MGNYLKEQEKKAEDFLKDVFIQDIQECIKNNTVPSWTKSFNTAKFFDLRKRKGYGLDNSFLLSVQWGKREQADTDTKIPCVGTFNGWRDLNKVESAKKDKDKDILIKKGSKAKVILCHVPNYWVNKNVVKDEKRIAELEQIIKEAISAPSPKNILSPYVDKGEICLHVYLKLVNVFFLDDATNLSDDFIERMNKIHNVENLVEDISKEDTELADKIVKAFTEQNNIKLINHKVGVDNLLKDRFSLNPYYNRKTNEIVMPLKTQYKTLSGYYGDLFHELGHSTMTCDSERKDKLDDITDRSKNYAIEELVAEFFACFMLNKCGIEDNKDNHIAYLAGWGRQIQKDMKKECEGNGENAVLGLFQDVKGKELAYVLRKVEKAVDNVFEAYREVQNQRNGGGYER